MQNSRAERNDIVRGLMAEVRAASELEGRRAQRVAVYAVSVGERLGISDRGLLDLRYAASLFNLPNASARISAFAFLQPASKILAARGTGKIRGARILDIVERFDREGNISPDSDPQIVAALQEVSRVIQFTE